MTIVELLERLWSEHQVSLRWCDTAGPVWSSPPPPEAGPAIEQLAVELEWAVRGAGTGHVWGQCPRCGRCQLVPLPEARKVGRSCRLTPYCGKGALRYVELPDAQRTWKALKAEAARVRRRKALEREWLRRMSEWAWMVVDVG